MVKYLIPIVMIICMTFIASAAMTGSETMTRTTPTSATPGSTFTVTYSAVGTSGTWGASIVDAVTGGCTFPDGTASYKSVMLSADGLTKSVTMTAPASGSCTFTGDYKYGDFAIKTFPSATVTIGSSCTPSNACAASTCIGQTCSDGCGGLVQGTKNCACTPNWQCTAWTSCSIAGTQTRTCTDANNCGITSGKPAESQSCSSSCTDTCSSKGFNCGVQTICGSASNCGTCSTGQTCNQGVCQADIPASYCEFTSKFALFPITKDNCTDGLIILIAGIVLIIILIK